MLNDELRAAVTPLYDTAGMLTTDAQDLRDGAAVLARALAGTTRHQPAAIIARTKGTCDGVDAVASSLTTIGDTLSEYANRL